MVLGRPSAASLPLLSILYSVLLAWSLCCGKVSATPLADGASSNMAELQKHVSFFDRNKDGIITPLETFQGFVAILKLPSPALLPRLSMVLLLLSQILFVQEKFDEIYTKHAHIKRDALTLPEVEEMLTSNRDPLDPASWPAAEAEWQLIYQLAHDRYGSLTKERGRGIYDGTIFVELEERWKSLHSDVLSDQSAAAF